MLAIPSIAAAQNLLLNGNISAGSDDAPQHWTITPGAPPSSFGWMRGDGEPPALQVTSVGFLGHNYYWSQTANLEQAGWYRVRALVKTEHPGVQAIVQISGAHGSASAVEGAESWSPLEVYFKVVNPNEAVRLECGVRGARGGRAFFRNLALSRIFGAPPTGAYRLDIGGEQSDLTGSEVQPFVEENISGSERAALRAVELAKTPANESLLREVLNFRTMVLALLAFMALALMDRWYTVDVNRAPQRSFFAREAARSAIVAALLCLALVGTWLVTRVEYVPGHGFFLVAPHAVAGDEPHYMIMINSLLLSRSFHLRTVYDDVDRGGLEAGVLARQDQTRSPYHCGQPAHRPSRNRNGGGSQRRPVASGFAARVRTLVGGLRNFGASAGIPDADSIVGSDDAAACGRGRARRRIHPDADRMARRGGDLFCRASGRDGPRMGNGGRSIIFLGRSPWLAYSRAYFAESTIGLALILGLGALMSDFPILATLAAAAGAIMKPPFALVAGGFFIEEVRERRWKDAVKIGAVFALALPVLTILAHNFWLYRRVLPMSQFVKTLVDPVEGLLLYAPWTIFGFFVCGRAFFSPSKGARLARTMALPLFLYLLAVGSVGFGAGYSYGPRYWVAFMPWLALATVEAMRRMGRYPRALCVVLILCRGRDGDSWRAALSAAFQPTGAGRVARGFIDLDRYSKWPMGFKSRIRVVAQTETIAARCPNAKLTAVTMFFRRHRFLRFLILRELKMKKLEVVMKSLAFDLFKQSATGLGSSEYDVSGCAAIFSEQRISQTSAPLSGSGI